MGKYAQYYGPEMETKLLRKNEVGLTPEYSTLLEQIGRPAAEQLKYIDRWESVPDTADACIQTANTRGIQLLSTWLADARAKADRFIKAAGVIGSQQMAPQLAPQHKSQLHLDAQGLSQSCDTLRKFGYVLAAYESGIKVEEARRFLDFLGEVNGKMDDLGKRLDDAATLLKDETATAIAATEKNATDATANLGAKAQEVSDKVSGLLEATNKQFDATLKSATEFCAQTKAQFEQSQEYVRNEAMDNFGRAFDNEAKMAEEKAGDAGAWAGRAIWVTIVAVVVFVIVELAELHWPPSEDKSGLAIQWAILRVSVLALCTWFIAHYFRERKNFLHVAVANRHRRNLCNAYIAVAQKMTPTERTQYLAQILPELSVLGKTGFISKEELPDTPAAQMLDVALKACGKK